MSRAFRALLWKEAMELRRSPILVAVVFFTLGLWVPTLPSAAGGGAFIALFFSGMASGVIMLALFLGFEQTSAESEGDGRPLAFHRPVSGAQIFGAKLVAAIAAIVISALGAIVIAAVLLAVTGRGATTFTDSLFRTSVASSSAAMAYYAAGLYAGSKPGSPILRWMGLGPAMASSAAITILPVFPVAIALCAMLTTVVVAAAWSEFTPTTFAALPRAGEGAST